MRYLIQLAYKGSNYHGWQKQPNVHSVQGELDSKLSTLLAEQIETVGCGRTDTGVHAKDFYAHFDVTKNIDEQFIKFKLNNFLPKDIVVYDIQKVSEEFNARFDAVWREYEYWITREPNPFLLDQSWFQNGKLNLDDMNKASALLIGKKDFESFSKVHTQVNNFICDVMHANWEIKENKLVFTIRANRFLRNMVRAIVGTLVDVGKGKITVDEVNNILASKNRCEAGHSVPAHGLFLTRIYYPHITQ
jgi:tRNA pseudouridine38-40 synthase